MNAWIAFKAWRQLKGANMGKWNSRKLGAVGLTAALAAINNQIQLFTPDVMESLIQLGMLYVGGQSAVDGIEKYRAVPPTTGG
jgi:hypothetical protein